MKHMKIAIIDSGIDINHKRLKGVKAYGISIRKNGNLFFFNSDFEDEIGHGTGITSIIYKLCPYAELFVIKVFHKSKTTSESILTQAILEAIKHNVHIINLSLGLFWQRPTEDLYNVCKLAYEKKIPIISAGLIKITHLC